MQIFQSKQSSSKFFTYSWLAAHKEQESAFLASRIKKIYVEINSFTIFSFTKSNLE